MTWTDLIKEKDLFAYQKLGIEKGVKKTGVCPRCKKSVVKFNMCPMNLPPLPIKPNCPMKIEEGD